jgi:hypothetical protein
MRTNWNKLAKNIPTKVQITSKIWYEVLLIKDFHGEDTYGEARYYQKQLVLKSDLGPKIKTETYLHEVFHALSEEHNVGLTEEQILHLESAFPYLIRVVKQLEGINE